MGQKTAPNIQQEKNSIERSFCRPGRKHSIECFFASMYSIASFLAEIACVFYSKIMYLLYFLYLKSVNQRGLSEVFNLFDLAWEIEEEIYDLTRYLDDIRKMIDDLTELCPSEEDEWEEEESKAGLDKNLSE